MMKFKCFSNFKIFFLLLVTVFSLKNETNLCALLPEIRLDINGNAVAVWEALDTNEVHRIFSSTFSNFTMTWSPPIAISSASVNAFAPQMSVAISTGNAVALWFFSDLSGNNGLQAAQYNGTWSAPATLTGNENPLGDYRVDIAENANGNMIAIWTAIFNEQFTVFTAFAIMGGPWTVISH